MNKMLGAFQPQTRRLYQLLLRSAILEGSDPDNGTFPELSDNRPGGDSDSFGSLVDGDIIGYDQETGLVNSLLPLVGRGGFQAVVHFEEGRQSVQVASVLDGFALASLLQQRVGIIDECPICGRDVHVTLDPNRIRRREPKSATVARVPRGIENGVQRQAVRIACSPEHALQITRASKDIDAVIQSIESLQIEARERYSGLLD